MPFRRSSGGGTVGNRGRAGVVLVVPVSNRVGENRAAFVAEQGIGRPNRKRGLAPDTQQIVLEQLRHVVVSHRRKVSGALTVGKSLGKRYRYAMPIRWKLREFAAKRGITGYEIAALTGISKQTIYKLMREPVVTRVNGQTLAILCDKLKVQPGALLEHVKRR